MRTESLESVGLRTLHNSPIPNSTSQGKLGFSQRGQKAKHFEADRLRPHRRADWMIQYVK